LDDWLETAGNTLSGLMATYKNSVQDLDLGPRALEYKADTIRDTLSSPTIGISRELATPTAWGTIAPLSTKLEEFGNKEVITPHRLSSEIAKCESRLRSQLDSSVHDIADTKGANVEAQLTELKSTLLQSFKVIQASMVKTTEEYRDSNPSSKPYA
jgi:hypothetical protein